MSPAYPFAPPAGREPLAQLRYGADELASGAVAAQRIAAPPERVWRTLTAMWSEGGWVPLVRRIRRAGDLITVDLRFRIALFSAGFQYVARVVADEPRSLELAWCEGEPRDMQIRFDLLPDADGAATLLYVHSGFDITSLGWLVKLVLKHHPEIRAGVHAGIALVLADQVRRRSGG